MCTKYLPIVTLCAITHETVLKELHGKLNLETFGDKVFNAVLFRTTIADGQSMRAASWRVLYGADCLINANRCERTPRYK